MDSNRYRNDGPEGLDSEEISSRAREGHGLKAMNASLECRMPTGIDALILNHRSVDLKRSEDKEKVGSAQSLMECR